MQKFLEKIRKDFKFDSLTSLFFRYTRVLIAHLRGEFYRVLSVVDGSLARGLIIMPGARIRGGKHIRLISAKLGKGCRMEVFSTDDGYGFIEIGRNFSCGDFCHFGSARSIKIGDGVLIGSHVLITDHDHGSPRDDLKNKLTVSPVNRQLSAKCVSIGDNVWIGDGVKVLKGVSIGDGSIIGANVVVRKDVPSWTVIKENLF